MFPDNLHRSVEKRFGAYLPHWSSVNGMYFLTFRLAGSLPIAIQKEVEWQTSDILRTAARTERSLTVDELEQLEELHFRKLDILHHVQGTCFLGEDAIARIVKDALMAFDGSRYRLFAWAIMPNHVHVVLQPFSEWNLQTILHSWKSFSAHKANVALQRKGTFWQPEYYDHLIRNRDDLQRCIDYTWFNSEKADLREWPWRWRRSSSEDLIS
jgi:REP element-mobilizing transposase RayT